VTARPLPPASLVLGAAVGFLVGHSALASQPPPQPEAHHPIVKAVHVTAPPIIDGLLDDPCWREAAHLKGLCCLDVDEPVPEETKALICVDNTAIYLAVICSDRTPADIVATETRRNGDIWKDDFVWLALDPWHQHEECYFFNVTARGTQCEQIAGGSAAKIQWRGDWRAAATLTPDGWQAEMAVPLSLLRYPPGQTTFGFNVGRRFARERISARYPAEMGRTADATRAADLVGLRLPRVSARPVLMPYLTADFGDFVDRRFDAGLDIKHTLPNGITALAAVNPDFKQIEDVVEPISFSYTERYLPDRRPFLVTGQEGYLPPPGLLYTRRIADFDAGLKLFGTIHDDTIGILDAVTPGEENALSAAWRHRFSDELHTNVLLVSHRHTSAPDSFCYGLETDHMWRTPEGSDTLWLHLYHSEAPSDEPGASCAVGGLHYRGVGRLRWNWQVQAVSDTFDPTLGYTPDTDYIGGEFNFGRWGRLERGAVEGRGWFVRAYHYPCRSGGILRSGIAPSYSWTWRRGRSLDLGVSRSRRNDGDSSDATLSYGWNTRDLHRPGILSLLKGIRLGGDYTYASITQGFHPTDGLCLRLGAEYSRLTDPAPAPFHGYQTVLTASYDLTPEHCLAARAIWRDAGFSAYATYRQVVRTGTDIYVILGDPDPTNTGFTTRLALKLIWTL
jgi:hypothetical protein